MKLWNTEDLAEFLGKSPKWVRENIERLQIPGFKLGQQWRFDPEAVKLWINQKRGNNFRYGQLS